MKPDWKDAPEWAQWLAMDGDGVWYWHQCQPEWEDSLGEWRSGETIESAAFFRPTDSLESRP